MTRMSVLRNVLDRPSPLIKQAPSVMAWLVACGLTIFVPGIGSTNTLLWAAGSGLILAATVFAALLGIRQHHDGFLILLIPIIDIVGFGLFRWGTGGVQSLFSSLILIPVVWLATAPGARYIVLVGLLTSLNFMLPYFANPPESGKEWLRGIISPLVFAAVAAVINELSRQQRLRTKEAEQLVASRTRVIGENERMIEQLRASEKERQALLESFEGLWSSITAQAIFATDAQGRVEAWTPGAERILGLSEEQALGNVIIDRFFPASVLLALADEYPIGSAGAHTGNSSADLSPNDLAEGIRALFAAADVASTLETDVEVITAAGQTVPARVTVTERHDANGMQAGYLLVITDESRAAEVARMKDEFVGMVSHEIRTPLSSIIGFLDLLQNDPEQPLTKDQSDFVEVIDRNANRLLGLVGDLLFTAQVESGSFPLTLSEFDLAQSIRVAAESAKPNAVRGGVEVVTDLPTAPLTINADPMRIAQAIDNLLSNAIKFTPQGGTVVVGARCQGDHYDLWVRDTGMGIPEAELGQLFTRFFRASTATRNAVPGIGLGLTIIRAIVIAHGGEMSVASDEGKGTEFRASLPCAAASAQ